MGVLRSGRRRREATPEQPGLATEEDPDATWHPVWVAMYEGGGPFKHWSLFVEDSHDRHNSFIIHAEGSSGNFRYEQRRSDAHSSRSLHDMIRIGQVHKDNLRRFREVCRQVEVKNQDPTWNCQDFVWNAMGAIAAHRLIDQDDEIFTAGRESVWSRMEGLI